MMVLAIALLACTDDPAPPVGDDGDPLSPWSYSEDPETPLYSAAEVEEMAAGRLPQLLGINPMPLYEAYNLAMSGQDRDCPASYEIAGVIGWGADCASSTGWRYWGRSQALYAQNTEIDGVRYERWGSLLTNARMTSPDDEVLYIVGYGDLLETRSDSGRRELYSYLLGEFAWDGPGSEGTWLRDQIAVSLIVESTWEGSGARTLRVDGGINSIGKDSPMLNAIDLRMVSSEAGGSCEEEPTGAMQLITRDPQDYRIDFDGTACDGCGDVSFEGELLGSACFDFADMLDWEEQPW